MPAQPSPKADNVSPSFPKVRFFILFPFVHRFGWPDAPGRWATLTPALSHRMGEGEASRTAAPRSAHGDERDLRVALIAHDARGVRVERGRAVHQELVLVMAVGQWDLEGPPAIRPPLHRIGRRVPMIEIPDQQNRFCLRCEAKETDRLGHVPGSLSPALSHLMGEGGMCAGLGLGQFPAFARSYGAARQRRTSRSWFAEFNGYAHFRFSVEV